MLLEVLSERFTLNAYDNLLQSFFSVYMPLEQKIQEFLLKNKVDYQYQEKLPFLIKDLNYINQSNKLNILKRLEVPNIASLEDFLGSLYVIEGSTLGGRLIQKMLKQHIDVESAAQFFCPYGLDTQQHWNNTVSFINSFTSSDSQFINRTCKSALDLFKVLNQVMQ
jgi:heme oxygenase